MLEPTSRINKTGTVFLSHIVPESRAAKVSSALNLSQQRGCCEHKVAGLEHLSNTKPQGGRLCWSVFKRSLLCLLCPCALGLSPAFSGEPVVSHDYSSFSVPFDSPETVEFHSYLAEATASAYVSPSPSTVDCISGPAVSVSDRGYSTNDAAAVKNYALDPSGQGQVMGSEILPLASDRGKGGRLEQTAVLEKDLERKTNKIEQELWSQIKSNDAKKMQLQDNMRLNQMQVTPESRYREQHERLVLNSEIDISDKANPDFAEFQKYNIQPKNYGQNYVGRITLAEYEKIWRDYLAKYGTIHKCTLYASDSLFTVYGNDCVHVDGFERLEAKADQNGMLASMMLIQKLNEKVNSGVFLSFLGKRYQFFEPGTGTVALVNDLNKDLCLVMSELSHHKYSCELHWFQLNDILMLVKFSSYNSKLKVMITFGTRYFFNDIEMPMIKRRLAVVRQELERNGLNDPSQTAKGKPSIPES